MKIFDLATVDAMIARIQEKLGIGDEMSKKKKRKVKMPLTFDYDSGWICRSYMPMWDDGKLDYYRHIDVKKIGDIETAIKQVVAESPNGHFGYVRVKTKGSHVRFMVSADPMVPA